MFYADNYQLSTTFYKQQQSWVEWRVGRGEESLCQPTSLCEDQRARERAQSVEGRRGIWQIIFDISRGFVGKIQIFWMQCSQLAQWKDIFTIVPDVMLDDWQLKCLILQDRNLHDDTVTQCQADAGISVQRREFYILGNSVNSGGWWRHGSSFLDNSVRGGFVGECLAPALSLSWRIMWTKLWIIEMHYYKEFHISCHFLQKKSEEIQFLFK